MTSPTIPVRLAHAVKHLWFLAGVAVTSSVPAGPHWATSPSETEKSLELGAVSMCGGWLPRPHLAHGLKAVLPSIGCVVETSLA